MRRREFIAGLGIAAMPFASSHAQQFERIRRVGVLMNAFAHEAQARVAAVQQGMQERGWTIGRNLHIEVRWGGNDRDLWRRYSEELIGSAPDVVVAAGATVFAIQRTAPTTLPIVVVQAIDPVGSGVVASLARPGANVTGFTSFEYNLAGKWVELLREISPGIKRIGVLRDPVAPAGIGQWAIISAASSANRIEAVPIDPREPETIVRGIAAFAREPNGGLIAAVGSSTNLHRLPVVSAYREFVTTGALVSYGPDLVAQYRSAAGYIDRILKGEKPADLPVQTPTRYQLLVNLKTAKAHGLAVPLALLARADEVIE